MYFSIAYYSHCDMLVSLRALLQSVSLGTSETDAYTSPAYQTNYFLQYLQRPDAVPGSSLFLTRGKWSALGVILLCAVMNV